MSDFNEVKNLVVNTAEELLKLHTTNKTEKEIIVNINFEKLNYLDEKHQGINN